MALPTFRDVHDQLGQLLREQGGLGAILMDLSPLAQIERTFGGPTYLSIHAQVEPLMDEMKQKVRAGDLLTRDEREGDRFMLFLARRSGEVAMLASDLSKLCDRVDEYVTPRVGRLTLPYLRARPVLGVGYGFVLFNPLESEDRQIQRLIDDALDSADLRRRIRDRNLRETLVEVVYNRQLWTAFQPIVEIGTRQIMGHEGLSRGPRGTELEPPSALFGLAARHNLVEELERACRRQAFIDWEVFGAPSRLFVNTVPATVRDTSFLGRGVIEHLGQKISPQSVTLEITERQVIENMTLYREAMHSFLDLGFTFAIDDVGAGYSGLETMATLGASYFKIDMALVRDVHEKRVNQQVIHAILEMGNGVGATVIAEGIQTQEEADCVKDIGIRYGQGYLFGRPQDPYSPKPRFVYKNGA